jgi:transcriptional regulator with XRE-family HTH domain
MKRIARRAFPTLAAWRDDAELSQADAAELAGITQAHWSRLESGDSFCSPKLAQRVSKLTGVSLETLLGIADSESGENAGGRQKTA